MRWRDYIARRVVTAGLGAVAAVPALRRFMVSIRPVATRLLYKRPEWDYIGHLSSERYINSHIALVQAPGWGVNTPPLAIARLSSFLRENNIKVMPVDINVVMYDDNGEKYPDGWSDSVDYFWNNRSIVERFIKENNDTLEQYIDVVINSGVRVVGFTIFESSYLMSCYIAREIKRRKKGVVVVFGGPGASIQLLGKDILKDNNAVDFVVEGEGEVTLLEIVKGVMEGKELECPGTIFRRNGEVVVASPRGPVKDIDSFPFPDFSDFNFFQGAALIGVFSVAREPIGTSIASAAEPRCIER
jgi:radical SAM superfamily enzyme YgiQ (UPF0313 family)